MRNSRSLLTAVAVSVATIAGSAHAAVWTFSKSGAPWSGHAITFAQPALDALIFDVTASGVAPTNVTRMSFQVAGTELAPEVANFKLVYYPQGRAGVVLGTVDNVAGLGSSTAVVDIPLSTPLLLQGDFAGTFALQVDVNGARQFFFQPQLQTVTVSDTGAERILRETGDLPLNGDSFYVK